jgi:hypothetical protein
MAAQPNLVKTKLDCEQQETKILEGTKGYPLNLMVEESGWLRELQVICDRHQHDFDILHLTGVVDSHNGKVCLLTEDEFGDRFYGSAEDIATAIGTPFPRLILLCAESEYSWQEREIATLAKDLISHGARAILTFGDEVAEVLIDKLYNELARGRTLDNALKLIYRESCRQERVASLSLRGPIQKSLCLSAER